MPGTIKNLKVPRDRVILTISKRKKITPYSRFYTMYRTVLAESCRPCPYFSSNRNILAKTAKSVSGHKPANPTPAWAFKQRPE